MIEVEMYVRTNFCDEIVIRKIVRIVCDKPINMKYLVFDKPTKYIYYIKQNNFKASRNIIDLIEVVDIITYKYCAFEKIYTCELENLELLELIKHFIEEKAIEIKSIVTKEQFKSMEYRIGE